MLRVGIIDNGESFRLARPTDVGGKVTAVAMGQEGIVMGVVNLVHGLVVSRVVVVFVRLTGRGGS